MKNNEITYLQLKTLVNSTAGMKLPSEKQLMESGSEIVAEAENLIVYKNGFYIYTSGEYSIVYRVDGCSRLEFKMLRREDDLSGEAEKTVCVEESAYENEAWPAVLAVVGDHHIEHNSDVRAHNLSQISLIDAAAEINAIYTKSERGILRQSRVEQYNMEREIIDGIEHQAKLALLPAAVASLKDNERRVIELYFDTVPRSEAEVAEIIGVSQQAVHNTRVKALRKMKEFYEKCGY